MTKLQSILFPKPGICFIPEMFYRLVVIPGKEYNPYHFDAQEQRLTIDNGGVVFFDTYFNGLSVGKWMKYTTVTKFALALEFKGTFSVSLLHSKYVNGTVVQTVLATEIIFASEQRQMVFSFPECEPLGAISFSVNSFEDGSVLYGGEYIAEVSEKPREINLALNICNYKREEYIYRNMEIIQKYILSNSENELCRHLSVFVADNSQSVDRLRLPPNCSYVYPQGDFGGAGGFARGLMEILRKKEELGLTHAVMIDDDILLEPDSLERLYSFLRFIKPAYQTAFVGGSLLRMDFQHVQTCNGGEWTTEKSYRFHKVNFDLKNLVDVLKNEIEDGASINAWWFHCIPLSEISPENLPYPFFFHMDDVEYDLRNCKQVIHMNGICVWHEPFEYKPGSHLSYYNTRNIFITHMLHFPEWNRREAGRFLWKEFFPSLLLYRYREAEFVLIGAADSMKGPDWLTAQEPELLLEDILSQGYKKQPLDVLPIRLDYGQYLSAFQSGAPENRWKRLRRRLSMNGYFFKSKGEAIIPMYKPAIRTVYRAKRVLNYDPVTERGFITQKSYKEAFRLLWRYLKVRRLINQRFKKTREEYLAKFPEMTTSAFWYSYLGVAPRDEVGSGAQS